MSRELKLEYKFGNEEYRLEYDPLENALYAIETTHIDSIDPIILETKNCGNILGRVKFDSTSVDSYIESAKGGYVPLFHEKIGIVNNPIIFKEKSKVLTQSEIDQFISSNPRFFNYLENIKTSSDDYLLKMSKCAMSIVDQNTQEIVESKVIYDRGLDAWWSTDSIPVVDIREILPLDICDAIIKQRQLFNDQSY